MHPSWWKPSRSEKVICHCSVFSLSPVNRTWGHSCCGRGGTGITSITSAAGKCGGGGGGAKGNMQKTPSTVANFPLLPLANALSGPTTHSPETKGLFCLKKKKKGLLSACLVTVEIFGYILRVLTSN